MELLLFRTMRSDISLFMSSETVRHSDASELSAEDEDEADIYAALPKGA